MLYKVVELDLYMLANISIKGKCSFKRDSCDLHRKSCWLIVQGM